MGRLDAPRKDRSDLKDCQEEGGYAQGTASVFFGWIRLAGCCDCVRGGGVQNVANATNERR